MLESEIEKCLVRKVREMGGAAYKFVSPGNTGVPDRIIILPGGRIWFAELKAKTGWLSPPQERQIERLRGLGMKVVVIRGMEGLEEWLDEIRTARLPADSL